MRSTKPTVHRGKNGGKEPALSDFLRFLDKQMLDHPESVTPVDAHQIRRIEKLIKGVK